MCDKKYTIEGHWVIPGQVPDKGKLLEKKNWKSTLDHDSKYDDRGM